MFVSFVSSGAQSDSELSPHHPSEVSVDCGYKSDSEVYTEHSKTRMTRSTKDVDVASSGWLVVSANIHTHMYILIYAQNTCMINSDTLCVVCCVMYSYMCSVSHTVIFYSNIKANFYLDRTFKNNKDSICPHELRVK